MSVIIRLQNLPWSANALDIRTLFKGLSIPEGGVHIVGGELGDAFIAFSTDEDARQGMMRDRQKINGVQVRLLLSSRAEMQKIIETARQKSLLALQNGGLLPTKLETTPPTWQKPQSVIQSSTVPGLHDINPLVSSTPSFLDYQRQAGITLSEATTPRSNVSSKTPEYSRADSPSPLPFNSHSRSRSRSPNNNDFDRFNVKYGSGGSGRHDDRENVDEFGRRIRGRSRSPPDRNKPKLDMDTRTDSETSKPWIDSQVNDKIMDMPPAPQPPVISNSYSTQANLAAGLFKNKSSVASSAALSSQFPGITTASNTYSFIKPFSLQNPYSLALEASVDEQSSPSPIKIAEEKKLNISAGEKPFAGTISSPTQNIFSSLSSPVETNKPDSAALITLKKPEIPTAPVSEQIAFATTNPYAEIYPNVFAQANATSSLKTSTISSPAHSESTSSYSDKRRGEHQNSSGSLENSSSIRVYDLCPSVTYSDIRKFFMGLFIPHNGIKLVTDKHGNRSGFAYVQFGRGSNAQKASIRDGSKIRGRPVKIQIIADEDFAKAEDGFRGTLNTGSDSGGRNDNRDNNRREDSFGGSDHYDNERIIRDKNGKEIPDSEVCKYNVLYLQELPHHATAQDIMKMFSSFTIFDILLTASPENRREQVAYVKFSRAEDCRAALNHKSKYVIGYRKIRVNMCKLAEMERVKEKLRLAAEQLRKEEEAMQKETADETRKLQNQQKDISLNNDIVPAELADILDDIDMDIEIESQEDNQEQQNYKQNDSDGNSRDTTQQQLDKNSQNYESKPVIERPSDPRLRKRGQSRFGDVPQNLPNKNNESSPPPLIPNFCNLLGNNMINNSNMGNTNNMGNINNMGNNNAYNMGNNMNRPMGNNMSGNNAARNMNQMNTFESNENKFVLIRNCPYNTKPMDIGRLIDQLKVEIVHIEPLFNGKGQPIGEFIVEVGTVRQAEIVIDKLNNTKLRNRTIWFTFITPQEIANRLNKPFMNYFPNGNNGDNGGCGNGGIINNLNNLLNNNPNNLGQLQNILLNLAANGVTDASALLNANLNDAQQYNDGGNYQNNGNDGNQGGNKNRGAGGSRNHNRFAGAGRNVDEPGYEPSVRSRRRSISHKGPWENNDGDYQDNSRDGFGGGRGNNDGGFGGGRGNSDCGGYGGGRGNSRDNYRQRDDSWNSDKSHRNNSNQNNFDRNQNNNHFNDGNGGNAGGNFSIPDKFYRGGCVVFMENVPYKAEVSDILKFFKGFKLTPDDVIRRFNDDGSPTGDARVSFESHKAARAALESRNRKTIFTRTIYLHIL